MEAGIYLCINGHSQIQPTNQNMSMNNNQEKCKAHFKQKTAACSSVNGVLAGSRSDVLVPSFGNQGLDNQIGRCRQNDNVNPVDAIRS